MSTRTSILGIVERIAQGFYLRGYTRGEIDFHEFGHAVEKAVREEMRDEIQRAVLVSVTSLECSVLRDMAKRIPHMIEMKGFWAASGEDHPKRGHKSETCARIGGRCAFTEYLAKQENQCR